LQFCTLTKSEIRFCKFAYQRAKHIEIVYRWKYLETRIEKRLTGGLGEFWSLFTFSRAFTFLCFKNWFRKENGFSGSKVISHILDEIFTKVFFFFVEFFEWKIHFPSVSCTRLHFTFNNFDVINGALRKFSHYVPNFNINVHTFNTTMYNLYPFSYIVDLMQFSKIQNLKYNLCMHFIFRIPLQQQTAHQKQSSNNFHLMTIHNKRYIRRLTTIYQKLAM